MGNIAPSTHLSLSVDAKSGNLMVSCNSNTCVLQLSERVIKGANACRKCYTLGGFEGITTNLHEVRQHRQLCLVYTAEVTTAQCEKKQTEGFFFRCQLPREDVTKRSKHAPQFQE
jgi:hypothetical protein